MDKIIEKALRESIKVKEEFIKENGRSLILCAEKISQAFTADRKPATPSHRFVEAGRFPGRRPL